MPPAPTPPGFVLLAEERAAGVASVRVEADCPHCVDHFPGDPVVPAIALLDLLAGLLAGDDAGSLVTIEALRLRGAVRPDDRLSVRWTGDGATGRSHGRILRGDEIVTEATLVTGARSDLAPPAPEAIRSMPERNCAYDPARLPHGPRARWVRRVLETDGETLVAEGAAPPGCALVRDGRLPAPAALELCAQAAALLELPGPSAGADASATRGYVVRARHVRLYATWLDAGVPLRATIRRDGAAPPLYSYAVRVTTAGQTVLTGSVSTYVPVRG